MDIVAVRSTTDALFKSPSILNDNAPEVECCCAGFLVGSSVAEIEDLGGVVLYYLSPDLCEMRGVLFEYGVLESEVRVTSTVYCNLQQLGPEFSSPFVEVRSPFDQAIPTPSISVIFSLPFGP